MPRPDTARRVKSYSAGNGYVYQYYFYEVNRVLHEGNAAVEFVYAISADRSNGFPVRILVFETALAAWAKANGRALTSSEEYAVAKMRLLQALDEGAVPHNATAGHSEIFFVDGSNLELFLQQLNI
ncbi:MAG: hypothetical protein WCE52_11010 [Candidatus Acidiferrum sp.]